MQKLIRILHNRRLLIYTGTGAAMILVIIAVILIVRIAGADDMQPEPRIVTLTIDMPDDIPLEEKEQIIYNSLLEAGFSSAGACGIMGNIAVESPDYDTAAVNESTGALGLFQWTNDGDRQQKMKDYCRDQKLNWNSIEAQLGFAIYELSGGDPIACRLDDFLRQTDNSYAAAAEFTVGFERCITDSGRSADRYMGQLYPEFYGEYYQGLSRRINKAMNYYIRFNE